MKRDLNTIFNGLSAVSAVSVTIIAAWAFFFTSIPDALIRSLQTDVADAREELTDLRRQKREVEENLGGLRSQIAALSSERDGTRASLEDLDQAHQRATTKLAVLEARERAAYESDRNKRLSNAFRGLGYRIDELREQAELVRTFSVYEEWARREPSNEIRTVFTYSANSAINAYRVWEREIPSNWVQEDQSRRFEEFGFPKTPEEMDDYLMGKLRGEKPKRTGPEPRIKTHREAAESFRKDVTEGKLSSFRTGYDVIEESMRGVPTDEALSSEDRARIARQLAEFKERYATELSRRLEVSLPAGGWTEDALLTEVRRAEGAISDFESAAKELQQQLSTEFGIQSD